MPAGLGRLLERVHGRNVHPRRVRVLARHLAELLPNDCRCLLDVGCGDGLLAATLATIRPGLEVAGVDILRRPSTHVRVSLFDGRRIPFEARTFDAVMLVDVLHHAEAPAGLLAEAARVSRGWVLVKDHALRGFGASTTLRFMDWVGNARHGVQLPYAYQTPAGWAELYRQARLQPEEQRVRLGLYPWPASLVFDRRLHFLARLAPAGG